MPVESFWMESEMVSVTKASVSEMRVSMIGVGNSVGSAGFTDVRYRLVFKNVKGFGIGFNLLLVPASISTLGKHSPSGVSIRVDKYSEDKLFSRCVVNNAAFDYYERCSEDGYKIKTPPGNLRIWLFQLISHSSTPMLQQGTLVDNSILKEYLGLYLPLLKLFLPDMMLGLKDRNDYASIYNEAIHELSHASHFVQVGKTYWETFIKYIRCLPVWRGRRTEPL